MAATADDIIDRRRLRRKLTFWRVVAILAALAAIATAGLMSRTETLGGKSTDHIARIRIEGTITEDDELIERIGKLKDAEQVKGVILTVDSPGGTTAGGEAIYNAIRELAEKKPVTAQVGTLAASAGYMVAMASDHIVARQSSIVGSIGVLVQIPNVRALLEKIGVQVDEVKSAPLKAEPSPFNETTPEELAMMRSMIMDSYEWFVGMVKDRRPLDDAQVRLLADGSVFTGRQGLQRKLVDELGGEAEAKAWLVTKGVDDDLKIVEWKKKPDASLYGFPLGEAAARLFGLRQTEADLLRKVVGDRLLLDGLISLWNPAGNPIER